MKQDTYLTGLISSFLATTVLLAMPTFSMAKTMSSAKNTTGIQQQSVKISEKTQESNQMTPEQKPTEQQEMTAEDMTRVSQMGQKVLYHVAQARTYIKTNAPEQAKEALKEAQTLVEQIESNRSASQNTPKISTLNKGAQQQTGANQINPSDLIPIASSFDEIREYAPLNKNAAHARAIKEHAKQQQPSTSAAQQNNIALKEVADAVIYTELNLPLEKTESHLKQAQQFLVEGQMKQADTHLQTLQENVQVLSFAVTEVGSPSSQNTQRNTIQNPKIQQPTKQESLMEHSSQK